MVHEPCPPGKRAIRTFHRTNDKETNNRWEKAMKEGDEEFDDTDNDQLDAVETWVKIIFIILNILKPLLGDKRTYPEK